MSEIEIELDPADVVFDLYGNLMADVEPIRRRHRGAPLGSGDSRGPI